MTHFHNCVMDLSFHEMERQVTLRKLRLKLNVNTNITY